MQSSNHKSIMMSCWDGSLEMKFSFPVLMSCSYLLGAVKLLMAMKYCLAVPGVG